MKLVTLLMLLVASVSAVAAEDACLIGASVLADQRALEALRQATEVSCPCNSYVGGPGLRRRDYLSCAAGVLKSTVAAGGLRTRCRTTARRINRGATCGGDWIACGVFTPSSAKHSTTCRRKPLDRCHDRRRSQELACTAQTYCADVVDWTAGTCVDIRDRGPYDTGVRVITYTKQSAVDSTQSRPLQTVIWYPARTGGGPIDPSYGGVLDAPLDASTGPYPLIMFSHGSCGFPTQSKFLWPLIASYGFVIAAPPHPGNTILEFPACSTPAALVASAIERPQDILFTLDQLLAGNVDASSPFFGGLDPARIGMAGHSFGGYTTYLTAVADGRFKVALPMAPAVPASMPVLSIPSLTLLSLLDTYVSNDAIRQAYAAAQPPKYRVEIENAGHFAYSDGCFPSPDCNPPVTMTQDEAHQAVLRWVLPFLEVHLVGDERYRPFLVSPPPPGIDSYSSF